MTESEITQKLKRVRQSILKLGLTGAEKKHILKQILSTKVAGSETKPKKTKKVLDKISK